MISKVPFFLIFFILNILLVILFFISCLVIFFISFLCYIYFIRDILLINIASSLVLFFYYSYSLIRGYIFNYLLYLNKAIVVKKTIIKRIKRKCLLNIILILIVLIYSSRFLILATNLLILLQLPYKIV